MEDHSRREGGLFCCGTVVEQRMWIDYSCPVRYRLYKPEDFAALYAIEEICFRPPHRFGRGYMRHLIEQHNSATWIAEDDGIMCGFAIIEWTRETQSVAYIQTLEVVLERRGQGVGGKLLSRLESSARALGASLIWLHVDAENAAAIRTYQAAGFVCEGREEDYYGPNRAALIYSKPLN
jgi:ribosomal protein S18 acetylase RimI-like enzyme